MPRNGSGSYTLPVPPFTPGTTISSSAVNTDLSDIASALTGSLAADGQTPLIGSLKNPDGTLGNPGITFNSDVTTGIRRSGTGTISLVGTATDLLTVAPGSGSSGPQIFLGGTGGGIICPVGVVTDYAGTAIPAGWLACFGQSLLRSAYPELFAAIGVSYGSVDGSHFTLPDCRGRVTAALDNQGGTPAGRITAAGGNFDATALGTNGGAQNHTIQISEMPSHNHAGSTVSITDPTHVHSSHFFNVGTGVSPYSGPASTNGVDQTVNTGAASTGITATNNVAAQGGGSPHTILNPVIVFYKIIFAGRP